MTGAGLAQQPGGLRYRIAITGTTARYADAAGLDLLVGTFFDEAQERSKAKVVVLGPGPVTELFGGDAGARDGQRRADRAQLVPGDRGDRAGASRTTW